MNEWVDNTAAVTSLVCVVKLRSRTTHVSLAHGHKSVRLTNLKYLVERHVCYPDVVFGVHRDTVRHVEEVTATVVDHGASSGVKGQHCGYSNRALGSVLEMVAGVERAAIQSKYWHCVGYKVC